MQLLAEMFAFASVMYHRHQVILKLLDVAARLNFWGWEGGAVLYPFICCSVIA